MSSNELIAEANRFFVGAQATADRYPGLDVSVITDGDPALWTVASVTAAVNSDIRVADYYLGARPDNLPDNRQTVSFQSDAGFVSIVEGGDMRGYMGSPEGPHPSPTILDEKSARHIAHEAMFGVYRGAEIPEFLQVAV